MASPNPEPEFVKELPEKYKCSICTNLLDTPVLTECCGQHFCKDCLEKWIAKKKATVCPHCRAENFNKIIYKPIIREINELQVYCFNRKNGCKEVLSYVGFQEHVDICPFGFVECTNACNEPVFRKDLKRHCQEECLNRIVSCSLCNLEGMHCKIAGDHVQECPELVIECPNVCGEKVKRNNFEKHIEECPLQVIECPFKEAGCEERIARKNLPDHETNAMKDHLRLTMSTMIVVKKENNTLKQKQQKHKEDFNTILSVISTELSQMKPQGAPPNPYNSIQTTLTSLTTMIQPDDQLQYHTVHISNKQLGMQEFQEKYSITALSPQLYIFPGHKIYMAVFGERFICVLQIKPKTNDYLDLLTIVKFNRKVTVVHWQNTLMDNINVSSLGIEETEGRLLYNKTPYEAYVNDFYVEVSFHL